MEEIVEIEIPKNLKNTCLPEPELIEYYNDLNDRIFWLDYDVDDNTLEIVKQIMRCNLADAEKPIEERKPIKIFINTCGGDVQVMWVLVNAIKISKTPVHTIVYCNALSAGAHILAAGHKRFAFPGATILVHSGSCQFGGDLEKVESAKKYFDNVGKTVNSVLLTQTKIMSRDLKRKGAADWYMTAEEALEQGVVDKIITDFSEVM